MGGGVPPSGRDIDPVLGGDPPERPPPVARQGPDPDGKPHQRHIVRVLMKGKSQQRDLFRVLTQVLSVKII